MGVKSGVPGRYGLQCARMVLLCPAIVVVGAGLAVGRELPSFRDGAALHRQPGLAVPAAQVDFAARDLQLEPGVEITLGLRLPSADQLKRAGSEIGAFILIRNIPEGLTLTEGMPIGTNWVMSLQQGGKARLFAREGMVGSHRLEFLLIGHGNRVLAETSVLAKLAQPKAKPIPDTGMPLEKPTAALGASAEPQKRIASPAPALPKPTISRDEEAILLAKGAELIGQGGIAAARLMFEEIAQQGSSQGALAMARTYDPAYIAAAPSGSIVPDIPKALAWYKRAADLGSGEASRRLSQLSR